MSVTASELRQNIYRLLDQVIETGIPLEINRKGKILKIITEAPKSKMSRLKYRNIIEGNPDDIVHLDWSEEWSEGYI